VIDQRLSRDAVGLGDEAIAAEQKPGKQSVPPFAERAVILRSLARPERQRPILRRVRAAIAPRLDMIDRCRLSRNVATPISAARIERQQLQSVFLLGSHEVQPAPLENVEQFALSAAVIGTKTISAFDGEVRIGSLRALIAQRAKKNPYTHRRFQADWRPPAGLAACAHRRMYGFSFSKLIRHSKLPCGFDGDIFAGRRADCRCFEEDSLDSRRVRPHAGDGFSHLKAASLISADAISLRTKGETGP
jgi:hypothetical protein